MVDAGHLRPGPGSSDNAIIVSSPEAGVVLLVMKGHARAEALPEALAELARFVKSEPGFDYFYDLWNLRVYDSPVRVELTDFHRRVGLRSLHTLTRSRVVAMGVAVANLALGNRITVHSSRESFDQRLAARCREMARGRSLTP
jgi:hypothetical protein